ncbi:UPF0711 protein C18orf21 homolog isoform X3 [Empidonax traillii]|uniref:UPF0711 protein C18orf21 homolog isoform X3 n=1 Tax=Empidonax traillii TaxID=164674 RepID=UPI000FFD84BD|nr:UPF0711 protein C18orf21 homolog isoform X3 [Empidonax traillii]
MGRRRLLAAAAARLAGACPGQARFLLWTLCSSRANERGLERICPYCFQFLVPDGYRLVTCKSCNKTTRHYGKSRDFLSTKIQNSGTPSMKSSLKTPDLKIPSSKKMTPVSSSRLGSKGNSPSTLPRTRESGQATSNSASKTPRNSRFHFSKLKQMLDLEEKERSQKADFKAFLTLL